MAGYYRSDQVRNFFDDYGDAEHTRFERSPATRVSLEIHRRFLKRHIRSGDRVLEVGAGPGVFTIQLAQLGARIAVRDISPRQLEMNKQRVSEAGR